MNAKHGVILIIIISIILIKMVNYNSDVIFVTSPFDKEEYLVRNLPDSIKASEILSHIRKDLLDFINYLHVNKRNYSDDNKKKVEKLFKIVKSKLVSVNIAETQPNTRYTTYTVNKTKLHFCLRHVNEKNTLSDYNTLMFVAIHELTHMMSDKHDPKHKFGFWQDMEFLLKEAIKMGVYVYKPYNREPVKYCGMTIDNTPYIMG